MADAAKGVRRLVLVHGRNAARQMVEPEEKSLVDIAGEVLGDDTNRKGYSYSGLCLTSLPHRKLPDGEAWVRTVGPLTLIVEPGRIKLGNQPLLEQWGRRFWQLIQRENRTASWM